VTLRQLRDFTGDALVHGVLQLVREHRPVHLSLVGGEPDVRELLGRLDDEATASFFGANPTAASAAAPSRPAFIGSAGSAWSDRSA
jgi:hypothetical protein